MEYNEARKTSVSRYILISKIIIIVELIAIIFTIYNHQSNAQIAQKKFDNDFLMYLELSNNALDQLNQSDGNPAESRSSALRLRSLRSRTPAGGDRRA
jgi:hypothetical protein